MTGETLGAWNRRMDAAPIADPARLAGKGGLVVLAPHPDDETLGCSAFLLEAARSGRKVGVVALTDGGHSHPGSTLFPPERLAAVRRKEQDAALEALGCGNAVRLRLGLADGGSGRDPRGQGAAARVAALCREIGATAILAPHPDDPHPDHHMAAALALELRTLLPALRILFYEVWSRRLEDAVPFRSAELCPFRVRTDPAAKGQAIACHASQLGRVVSDAPDGFAMPPWFLALQNEPTERVSWLAMPGRVPAPEHFRKLYADDGDPWHVRASPYEIAKREASVAILRGRHFRRSLEAGCGEGHLTGALLREGLVAEAVGTDRDVSIIERAQAMGWGAHASFLAASMPDGLPPGPFDLVIFSEVLYFLDEEGLAALARNIQERLADGAVLLAVSYLGPTDTPLGGRDSADFFFACLSENVRLIQQEETADYRMELAEWRRAPGAVREDDGAGPTAAAAGAPGGG